MAETILQHQLAKIFTQFKDNIAIECSNRQVTYEYLDQQSNIIAHWLLEKGMAKETLLGVLMEDKINLITMMIGILKAGVIFIPLDSASPPSRLEVMIKTTAAKYIFCDRENFTRVGPLVQGNKDVELIIYNQTLFNETVGKNTNRPFHWPALDYSPQDHIYIYFTSGSTGTPRAMIGVNKSLCHFIDWEIETFGIDEKTRISQLIHPTFDAFLRDVYVPLCSGGRICIPAGREILLEPTQLANWVQQADIRLIHCTPSLFKVLNSLTLTPQHFQNLEFILLSGEKIEPANLVKWFAVFADRIKLVNLWGTSETTLAKTYYFIREHDIYKERIPVGKPIKGARVIVLDQDMNVCDQEVMGEIYIRTPYRTSGYLNDPGLNQERFIQNPFNPKPGDIIHKTGDIGRKLPDGNLDISGRVDRQVKIRGIRLELEEIESVLLKHPGIKEAVVIKKELPSQNELLYAFVVPAPQVDSEKLSLIEDLNRFLAVKLPDYMHPAKITTLEKIPRKPNGKIDYQALPDPPPGEKTPAASPTDWIEQKILETWCEILAIESIGVTDNFFQLGGNSLNLMTLIARIHQELDIQISLAQIFNNPTIREQAAIVKNSLKDLHPPIEPAEEKEYYELSPVQLRAYLVQQVQPGSTTYNMTQAVVLEGQLEPGRLQTVFDKIIHRQASFRTSFPILQGQIRQKIHPEVEFEIEVYQVEEVGGTGEPAARGLQPWAALIRSFIRPFDLSRAPLLRVGLLQVETEKNVLIVDMHHVISDGISLAILVGEFTALYKGETLPLLKIRYVDYSQWQSTETRKKILKAQEKYWLKELHGDLPQLALPIDFPRSSRQEYIGNSINYIFGKDEKLRIKAIAKEEQVTLFMLLLAICNVMLAKVSGQEDIIVGIPTANRDRPELQSIIGIFANSLVFRNYPQGTKTFRDFLQEVKERTIQGFSNQDYSFTHLVEHLALQRETGRNILFDVQFQLEEFNIPEVKIPDMKLEGYGLETTTVKLDLILAFAEAGDILYLRVEYNINLFKKETIERFIQYVNAVLQAVLDNPAQELSEIEILSKAEKKKITARYDIDLEKESGWV